MSKVSKYDKLYKYINKRIANSVERLEEKLKEIEKEEIQYRGSVVAYCVEPNYESIKEKLRCKIIDKMTNSIMSEISNEKFIDVLYGLIDSKHCKESDIYNKAGVSKQVFSNIRQGIIPKVSTVVKLALALECETTEFEKLLKTAGYTLQESNAYDMMIIFLFNNKIFRDYNQYDKYLEYYEFFEAVKAKWPNHKNKYKDWFAEEKQNKG